MDDFYTDEPILGFTPDGIIMPRGMAGGSHPWDYYAPTNDAPSFAFQRPKYSMETIAAAPKRIQELIRMICQQPWQITKAKTFREQAEAMSDYADDVEVVPFMTYFPTYADMTIPQMRSYFTVRSMLRQGKQPDAPLSYLFVFVYETLMQVGVSSKEEGYEALKELQDTYKEAEPSLGRYLRQWLKDYVVYYNMPDHFADEFSKERDEDLLAEKLADYGSLSDADLLDAVCHVSRYDIRRGALYNKEKERTEVATAAVLRSLIPEMETRTHHRFITLCLGKSLRCQHQMFASAVFYIPKPVREAEIEVAPRHKYVCKGGFWTRNEYVTEGRQTSRELGIILRETDRQLRLALHVGPKLRQGVGTAAVKDDIYAAICRWMEREKRLEAEREMERMRVTIDFGKLEGIRSDAEVVRDRLLEGTELDSEQEPAIEHQQPQDKTDDAPKNDEMEFLRIFLAGGDWRKYLREHHIPEGVMIENINDKALEAIGDIVIDDSGDGPQLIEDYRADIEKLIN